MNLQSMTSSSNYVPAPLPKNIAGAFDLPIYRIDEETHAVLEVATWRIPINEYEHPVGIEGIYHHPTKPRPQFSRGVTHHPLDIFSNLASAYIKWGFVKVKSAVSGEDYDIYDISNGPESKWPFRTPFYPVKLYFDTTKTAEMERCALFIIAALEEMVREHLTELSEEALVRSQIAWQTISDHDGARRKALYAHLKKGAPAMDAIPDGTPMYRHLARQDANKYQKIAQERSIMMYDLLAQFEKASKDVNTIPGALTLAENLFGLPANGFCNPLANEPWYIGNFMPRDWFYAPDSDKWLNQNTTKLRNSGAGASFHQMSSAQMGRLLQGQFTHTLEQSGAKHTPPSSESEQGGD